MTSLPISAPALLSRALSLYRTHAKSFLVAAAIALLPIFVLHAGLTAALLPSAVVSSEIETRSQRIEERNREMQRRIEAGTFNAEAAAALNAENMRDASAAMASAGGTLAGIGAFLLSLVLLIPLMLIGTFFGSAALVPMVDDRAEGGTMTPGAAWARLGARAVPLIVTAVIAAVAVAIGLFFLVVPGLVLGFLFAFAAPVVMLENIAGPGALKRSAKLVMANLIPTAIVVAAIAILSVVARAVGGLLIPARFGFLHTLTGDLVSLVVFPLPIIALVLLFREVRQHGEEAAPLAGTPMPAH